MKDQYLGDGVYASFDGYHIVLDLRGQDDTTKIALEPEVFHKLMTYQKALVEHFKREEVLREAQE